MGVNICLLVTGVHFSSGVTSQVKLASQEVKGVTHFEKAVIVEGLLWLK
jgi:hypothetical protein